MNNINLKAISLKEATIALGRIMKDEVSVKIIEKKLAKQFINPSERIRLDIVASGQVFGQVYRREVRYGTR